VLDFWQRKKKSLIERLTDRLVAAVEEAAGSAGRAASAAGRATSRAAEQARRRGGSAARASREAVGERMEAVAQRAAQIRERRRRRREAQRQLHETLREAGRRRGPIDVDLSGGDRITVRSRQPLNIRTPDGGLIRYRYYERPSRLRRFFLHLTGRQVWPRP
jgi:hypothetical protein